VSSIMEGLCVDGAVAHKEWDFILDPAGICRSEGTFVTVWLSQRCTERLGSAAR
jgi:hypothetical protein